MNNFKSISILIIIALILSIFACSLFTAPSRDNPNDPEYDGDLTLPGLVEGLRLSPGADSLTVNWDKTIDGIDKCIIYWDTAAELTDTAESAEVDAATETNYIISGLHYGTAYNVWMRLVDEQDGTEIYSQETVTVSAVVEPGGIVDTSFSEDGLAVATEPESTLTDVISAGNGEFYAGGDKYFTPGPPQLYTHIIKKMNSSGSLVTTFATSGTFNGSDIAMPIPYLSFVLKDSELVAFLVNFGTDVSYYNNFSVSTFNNSTGGFTLKKAMTSSDGDVFICGDITSQLAIRNLSGNLSGTDYSIMLNTATEFPGMANSYATSMVISNNHLYSAGYVNNGAAPNYVYLGSYNPANLALEFHFNVEAATWQDHGTDILVTAAPEGGAVYIAAYNLLGKFDVTSKNKVDGFGTSGLANGIDSLFVASDIMVQPNGKILLAGTSDNTNGILYRFNADGILDAGFANNGAFIRDNYIFNAVDVLTNGRIVIGGRETAYNKGAVWMLK
ncbi:MAG: hypothetical protein JEZ04_09445 [Spirochaetales bacterium]|nr:hypothetical protein [Spirochaetales bacterium]